MSEENLLVCPQISQVNSMAHSFQCAAFMRLHSETRNCVSGMTSENSGTSVCAVYFWANYIMLHLFPGDLPNPNPSLTTLKHPLLSNLLVQLNPVPNIQDVIVLSLNYVHNSVATCTRETSPCDTQGQTNKDGKNEKCA